MTNEEITSKDFQILTSRVLLYNASLLRTILHNQTEIMRKLNIENSSNKEVNKLFKNYTNSVDELFKNAIPNYSDVNPPLKD